MSDIIEELRALAFVRPIEKCIHEAADEIARLREENARLRNDLKNAIFSDLAYTKEIERQDVLLREENARLREALKPFADNRSFVFNGPEMREALRAARAAIREGGKDGKI